MNTILRRKNTLGTIEQNMRKVKKKKQIASLFFIAIPLNLLAE